MRHLVVVVLVLVVSALVCAAQESATELAFASRPAIVAFAGEGYEYAPKVTGAESATFTLKSGPGGMRIDPATGKVTWLPTHNHAPFQQVAIEVSSAERLPYRSWKSSWWGSPMPRWRR